MAAGAGEGRRIVIIDDHPIVRHGLAELLNRHRSLQVVGEAGDSASGYELVRSRQPDAAILDISLPGASGLDLLGRLVKAFPEVPVLVVSMLHEEEYAERVIASGARGYIMKQEAAERIVEGTLAVLAGKLFLRGAVLSRAQPREARAQASGVASLSNLELEVLRLLGSGHSTRAIAEALHKSPKSVELYRSRIRSRLGLKSANDLIIFAARWLREHPEAPGR